MTARVLARERGVATIELAVILGLLASLVLGIVELSRATQQFATLSGAARAAARLASASASPEGIASAQCLAVYGRALESCVGNSAGAPLLPGLSTRHVLISVPADLRDASGALVHTATPGLASIQARAADGSSAGTLDLLTVTVGPPGARYRFVPLMPAWMPSFEFAPISVSMAMAGH
ncbi:MAG: hypothetical protein EBT33_05305 [Betaproteobacteria bacterium]|nr:hypothetical protein [Betaproteobacteria bacterium]